MTHIASLLCDRVYFPAETTEDLDFALGENQGMECIAIE